MPNDRFSQYFRHWMNRIRGPMKASARRPRMWPKLGVELFEERVVPASLPAPVASSRSTIGAGFDPSVAVNPADPNQLVMASTTGTIITVRSSVDGGITWRTFFTSAPTAAGTATPPERIYNPAINPSALVSTPSQRAYTNAYNPTVAFTRPDTSGISYVYLSHLETDNSAGKLNGALVLHKFDMTTATTPTSVNLNDVSASEGNSTGKILYTWANQDPILNPTIAVDNNLASFTDPGLDDVDGTFDFGETTYTDTMSRANAPIYVAWNTNATAPQTPFQAGLVFNPNRIFVMASSDAAGNFTNAMEVDDNGYLVDPTDPIAAAAWGSTAPLITFSPNNSQFAGAGELVFAWTSTRNNRMFTETSAPDGAVPDAPYAGSQKFAGPGGLIQDALPALASVTSFTAVQDPLLPVGNISFDLVFSGQILVSSFTTIDINFIQDLTTVSNFSQPFTILPMNAAGNATTTANTTNRFLIRAPLINGTHTFNLGLNLGGITAVSSTAGDTPLVSNFTRVILPTDIVDPLTNVTDLNVSLALSNVNRDSIRVELLYYADPTANVANTAADRTVLLLDNRFDEFGNLTAPAGFIPVPGLPAGAATLNKDFIGVYDFNLQGNGFSNLRNVVGTVFDDDAPRDINDPANIQPFIGSYRPEGWPFGDTLTDFDGFTNTELVGTWAIRVTDYRFDGVSPPIYPTGRLEFWSLDVTSHIDNAGMGTDTLVSTNGVAPLGTNTSGVDSVHPTKPTAAPIVGVGAGQSIAFDNTAGSFSPFAGRMYLAYTSGTNVFLANSDDNGATWNSSVQVNDDSIIDNTTEGSRAQFMPNVTVDPLTGAVVVTWYDARLDAADSRVTTFIAVSLDGGESFKNGDPTDLFSPQVSVNRPNRARDTITNKLIDTEPIPSDLRTVGNDGFGTSQAVVAFGGRVNVFWSGNNNGGGLSVQTAAVRIGAGPRVIYSDSGPIVSDTDDPLFFTTYNNTFTADGTRQIDGFSIVFDRPIDVDSFNLTPDSFTGLLDVEVYFLAPDDNPINGGVLGAGTPVAVGSITPLDTNFDVIGAARTFFVSFATPQNQVGTYSYLVRNVRDTIRNPDPTLNTQPATGSDDTPLPILDLETATSTAVHPGLPAGQVIDNVIVTLAFDHTFPSDLVITLTSPSGTSVLLFDGPNNFWGTGFVSNIYDYITFNDFAPGDVGTLASVTNPATGAITYTGNVTPDALIAFPFPQPGLSTAFDGEGAGGTWTLTVDDTVGGDVGTLTAWSIVVQGTGGVPLTDLELGNLMDQDADAVYGETNNDVFSAPGSTNGQPLGLPYDSDTLPLILPGPHLVSTSPSQVLGANASSVIVTFDRDMNPASFTAADVLRMNTPAGVVTSGFTVTMIDARNYRIGFPTQRAGGAYSIELGPNILSASGFLMDNNLNAGLDRLRGGNPATAPLRFNEYDTTSGPVTIAPNTTVSMPLNISDAFAIMQTATQPPGTDPATLNAIQLRMNITFPRTVDLIGDLVSPTGTRIRLFTRVGPSSPTIGNFSNTLFTDFGTTAIQNAIPQFDDGPYTPQFALSTLIGETSFGNWRLEITNTGSSTGTIDDFTLRLPFAESGTGLGENPGDKTTAGFTIYNLNPTDETSRDVWTPVGPTQVQQTTTSQVGRMTAVAVDPSDPTGNTVFAGAVAGGVWKTTNFLTTDQAGPTWVPMTDFGSVGSLLIGSLTVIARNNDPNQSIIFATTGNASGGSPNVPLGNNPGVGLLRSLDGGRTWRLLDSTTNVDAAGNITAMSSALRDHIFVGSVGFQLAVDPYVDAFGDNVIYMALSGSGTQNGIWRSKDSGDTWTRILSGNATDVVLAAGSQGVDGNLEIIYAAVDSVGVYIASNAPMAAPVTAAAPLGSFIAVNGGTGNPLIQNGGIPLTVGNPANSPAGDPGFIKLAVPALTSSPLKNEFYQGWVYAMTTQGIYMTKDYGANWTLLQLPAITTLPALIDFGTNNETRPDEDVDGFWFDFGFDLFVDPQNPNFVYAGGQTMVKIDTTLVKDPQNFTTVDYSDASLSTQGGVNAAGRVRLYNPSTGAYTTAATDYINLERDPNNPFLSPSSIPVTGGTAFLNNGANVKWQPVSNFIESRGLLNITSMVDPLSNKVRILYTTETGVYSVIDAESGQIGRGLGTELTNIGFLAMPSVNRNGTLQVALLISGAVQPSQLAADLAGAMFYSMTPIVDMGSPVSGSDVLTSGDRNYFNGTNAGSWVAVDPSGTGNAYQFQSGGVYFGSPSAYTDFFRFIGNLTDPTLGGISHTNGLFFPGGAGGGTAQWQQFSTVPGFFPPTSLFGQATINPRDPDALLLGSSGGRLYRSTDGAKNWFPINSPADFGNSYAMAVSFGAPNSNASIGPVIGTNNFIYAGTQAGQIYVTLTGGAPWKQTFGLDGSAVQKIISSPISGRFDAYAVTTRGVYYLPDARIATPIWQNITGNLFSLQQNLFGVNGDSVQAVTQLTTIAVDWRGIGSIPNDANTAPPAVLYVGGDGGVFRTKNAGNSAGTIWTIFPDMASDGSPTNGGYLPHNRVMDLDLSTGDIDPNTGQPKKNGSGLNMLVATTYGRGQWAIRLDNALPTNAIVSGPKVLTAVDNGLVGGFPSMLVTFNGPVYADSFTPSDVSLTLGSTTIGVQTVTAVANVDPVTGVDKRDTFRIVFNSPVVLGSYTLKIGQNVTDLAGNQMNQDGDNTNGEAADAYTQTVVVSSASPIFSVLAKIAGAAFIDFNADGLKQTTESALSGRTVYLDLDNNNSYSSGEPIRTTDVQGRYDFGSYTAGNYAVREDFFGLNTLTGNAASTGKVPVNLLSGNDQNNVDLGHRLIATIYPTRLTTGLFGTTYANSNTAYVYNVFKALLGHDPTSSEVTYHVNSLNGGYSRTDYATSIYNRDESLYYQVDKIFQTTVKHAADATSLAFWAQKFREGVQPEWLVVGLVTGNEYTVAHSTTTSYIQGLFNDILGRTAATADITFWTNYLKTHSRFDMAFALAYSSESYTKAVKDVFTQYLHRDATQADINHWVNLLVKRQITVARMSVLLIASSEFSSKAVSASG